MTTKFNEQIIKKLNELHLTITTCESMTGGALASNLVLVEHASNCFLGSMITYSAKSKIKLAKVRKETIDQYGTVSIQCAREMAIGCQNSFQSDIAISVTGNASIANPIEGQPSGMAYICIKAFDKLFDFQFNSSFKNRTDTINECVAFVLNKL
ncbi:MAG: nicotinamide-nucleotide amidohydrolase family protein [Mycoplasmoidaceae bacterium]|nr:nicotinamide-nucleotide amidohydrolase family protein [Mycoplasmoidaceae bacterium]